MPFISSKSCCHFFHYVPTLFFYAIFEFFILLTNNYFIKRYQWESPLDYYIDNVRF